MAVSRRRYDPRTGLMKKPDIVLSAVIRGCAHLYARCDRCKVTVEVPIDDVDPMCFIPDAGLGMACADCGHKDIETWPKYPSIAAQRGLPYVPKT
jgi:hypothetical protein